MCCVETSTSEVMEDSGEPSGSNETISRPYGQSLLEKYNIPVHHADFAYIETCRDKKELSQILKVLRSGEEGHYPDLTKFTEERLQVIDPKNKLLRNSCPVINIKTIDKEEQSEIDIDLKSWLKNVNHNDKELGSRKSKNPYNDADFPKIREVKPEPSDEIKLSTPKRISTTDYESWSKYDPDTEILKMEINEDKEKEAALEEEKRKEKLKKKKSVTFNKFATEAEACFEANREKEKGNECFKSGEYSEAFDHYSLSIKYKPSLASYNNRAITSIKLKRFQEAMDDCERALTIESDNVKALTRKALALEGLGRYEAALMCLEKVIQMDPNDAKLQEMAAKLTTQAGRQLKNKRMVIQDE